MLNSELEKYIKLARSQNVPENQIKDTLIKSGWAETDINEALFPQSATTNLPPPPVPHFGMWVTFKYIILFISLYITATSLGGILHNFVDQIIPDVITRYDDYDFSSPSLTGYMAAIAVSFPIFVWLFISLSNEAFKRPAIKNIRARKLLIYFTLVVTFLFMIGHLIATIYSFLEGTLAARTIGHLVVTLVVAGSIFLYLLNEVRGDRKADD